MLDEPVHVLGGKEAVDVVAGFEESGFGGGMVEFADFFAEIGGGFDHGEDVEDVFADGFDFVAEVAGAEAVGGAELGMGGGFDGGADAFGLGEVKAAVHEGA